MSVRSAFLEQLLFTGLAMCLLSSLVITCQSSGNQGSSNTPVSRYSSDTVTLAFYNTENLFDFRKDGTEYPEYVPEAGNWTEDIYRRKLENIASAMVALDPDILMMCEVENENALGCLSELLRKKGLHYGYRAFATANTGSSTSPAVLSKYALSNTKTITTGTKRNSRPILETRVDCNGAFLTLFVNHWPSKSHPESDRLIPAMKLRKRLSELPQGTDYIIAGDLNADYDECTKTLTTGMDDTKGLTGINHILRTVVSSPDMRVLYVTEQDFVKPDSLAHYDLWLETAEQSRFSHVYQGNRGTPDHILLPASMYDSSGFSYADNSFAVFTWGNRLMKGAVPFRWQVHYKGRNRFHAGAGYSDHLPVYARILNAPFTRSKTDVPLTRAAHPGTGSFEVSLEGFISCSNQITVTRDTMAHTGAYSLHCEGNPGSRNMSACRTIIKCKRVPGQCSFYLLGTGKLSVRLKHPSGEWAYYNGPSLKQASRSARYVGCSFPRWTRVSFPYSGREDRIELELRAGKGTRFSFRIDDIKAE